MTDLSSGGGDRNGDRPVLGPGPRDDATQLIGFESGGSGGLRDGVSLVQRHGHEHQVFGLADDRLFSPRDPEGPATELEHPAEVIPFVNDGELVPIGQRPHQYSRSAKSFV